MDQMISLLSHWISQNQIWLFLIIIKLSKLSASLWTSHQVWFYPLSEKCSKPASKQEEMIILSISIDRLSFSFYHSAFLWLENWRICTFQIFDCKVLWSHSLIFLVFVSNKKFSIQKNHFAEELILHSFLFCTV